MADVKCPPAGNGSVEVIGMACKDCNCDFKPYKFRRRAMGDNDVLIEVHYCGVCHSDLHVAANHFVGLDPKLSTKYPAVVGHEQSGVAVAVGKNVTKFKVGDHVGVGCLVDGCGECAMCQQGHEQYCSKAKAGGEDFGVQVYQSKNVLGKAAVFPEDSYTQGGYATKMVIHENFAVKIPKDYPLECAGPILCSWITMYEPLQTHGATEGTKVGIVGMGGLGIMGVQLAKAIGCEVTAISRGTKKNAIAKEKGADHCLNSKSDADMAAQAGTLDLIISTVPVHHDITPYWRLLKPAGNLVIAGLTPMFLASVTAKPVGKAAGVVPTLIGGIQNTQAVMDLVAKAGIKPNTKVVPVSELNNCFTKLDQSNDSALRYVLDIKGTLSDFAAAQKACTAKAPELSPPKGMGMGTVLGELSKLIRLAMWRNKFKTVSVITLLVGAGYMAYKKYTAVAGEQEL